MKKPLEDLKTGLWKSLRPSAPIIAGCLAASAVLLAAAFALTRAGDVPLSYLTRDVSSALEGKPYAGILSNLGIVAWFVTGFICLFSTVLLSRMSAPLHRTGFLFFAALITLVLACDDLFLFHDWLLPKLTGGNPEIYLLLFYGAAVAAFGMAYRRVLLNDPHVVVLLLALCSFALSVFFDLSLAPYGKSFDMKYLLEDGLKLTGIVLWSAFFVATSKRAVLNTWRDS